MRGFGGSPDTTAHIAYLAHTHTRTHSDAWSGSGAGKTISRVDVLLRCVFLTQRDQHGSLEASQTRRWGPFWLA